ncbi:MAG TPA: serine hydrolase [Ignavibacteriaceae bacterium]|nr:serine hydrolase [Ignavibacteriaceae bacterium]
MFKKIFFLLFVTSTIVFSQTLPNFLKDSIDVYVSKALRESKIPGLAVCVVKDGKVTFIKGYGVKDIIANNHVDENTLFLIGSNTKAFTGTSLAILEQEGKCSLTDKVKKWLPDFKMKDVWVENELNLQDIVSHRIGMETFQGDFMYWDSDLSTSEILEKFGKLAPKYPFRTKWGYTNAGFVIAGQVIEKVSGESWDEFIQERFFKPLEMNNSLALTRDINSKLNIAVPYTIVDNELRKIPYPDIDNLAPAASISSSVTDMSHWLITLLDSGKYNGKEVIPFKAILTSRKPLSIIGNSSNPFDRNPFNLYGMGWEIESYRGNTVVSHTGGVDGFVTSVTLLPKEKLGVVVLTNTDANVFYQALKWQIIDAYLNAPYNNYHTLYSNAMQKQDERQQKYLSAMRDSVKMNLKPTVPLEEFEGTYKHEVFGEIEIEKDGNNLKMVFKDNHPDLVGKLESIGDDKFLCTYSQEIFGIKEIPFVVENGKVKSFTLSVADFVEFTTYNFVKED